MAMAEAMAEQQGAAALIHAALIHAALVDDEGGLTMHAWSGR
jgi:hypothetical protein